MTSRSTRVNTPVRKGKVKISRGRRGEQSDTKRAIVTLEEGHRIDVDDRIVRAAYQRMAETYKPTTPRTAPARPDRPFVAL